MCTKGSLRKFRWALSTPGLLYLFNTATDRVYFWHACTLGPGLYSPNVFGDAALINYANLCKFSQNHIKCSYFLISRQILFKYGIPIYYRLKKKSPNDFGDAALINYANLCKFCQNHIKCSYFLISWQIFLKFGIQIYYRFKKSPSVIGDAALIN